MSLKREYRDIKKVNRGPGGWKCPCCSQASPRKIKPLARKIARHKNKQSLKNVVKE